MGAFLWGTFIPTRVTLTAPADTPASLDPQAVSAPLAALLLSLFVFNVFIMAPTLVTPGSPIHDGAHAFLLPLSATLLLLGADLGIYVRRSLSLWDSAIGNKGWWDEPESTEFDFQGPLVTLLTAAACAILTLRVAGLGGEFDLWKVSGARGPVKSSVRVVGTGQWDSVRGPSFDQKHLATYCPPPPDRSSPRSRPFISAVGPSPTSR